MQPLQKCALLSSPKTEVHRIRFRFPSAGELFVEAGEDVAFLLNHLRLKKDLGLELAVFAFGFLFAIVLRWDKKIDRCQTAYSVNWGKKDVAHSWKW
jgi:hypothetical protein